MGLLALCLRHRTGLKVWWQQSHAKRGNTQENGKKIPSEGNQRQTAMDLALDSTETNHGVCCRVRFTQEGQTLRNNVLTDAGRRRVLVLTTERQLIIAILWGPSREDKGLASFGSQTISPIVVQGHETTSPSSQRYPLTAIASIAGQFVLSSCGSSSFSHHRLSIECINNTPFPLKTDLQG